MSELLVVALHKTLYDTKLTKLAHPDLLVVKLDKLKNFTTSGLKAQEDIVALVQASLKINPEISTVTIATDFNVGHSGNNVDAITSLRQTMAKIPQITQLNFKLDGSGDKYNPATANGLPEVSDPKKFKDAEGSENIISYLAPKRRTSTGDIQRNIEQAPKTRPVSAPTTPRGGNTNKSGHKRGKPINWDAAVLRAFVPPPTIEEAAESDESPDNKPRRLSHKK